jgi:two-component system, LytTR family, response regulator LytT
MPRSLLAVGPSAPAVKKLLASDTTLQVGTAVDGESAIRVLTDHVIDRYGAARQPTPVDVLLVDVSTPGVDPTDLAAELRSMPQPPHVVLLIDDDDPAAMGIGDRGIEYLFLPLRPAALTELVARLIPASPRQAVEMAPEDTETIPVERCGQTILVPRATIRYIEANGDYARLHCTDGQSHLVRVPLTTIEERWGEAGFLRIHRSYVVNTAYVTGVRVGDHPSIRIGNGPTQVELTISRRFRSTVGDRFARNPRAAWTKRSTPVG